MLLRREKVKSCLTIKTIQNYNLKRQEKLDVGNALNSGTREVKMNLNKYTQNSKLNFIREDLLTKDTFKARLFIFITSFTDNFNR